MGVTDGGHRASFASTVNRLHVELVQDGVPFADMRRGQPLELVSLGASEVLTRPPTPRASGIEPLEGPIQARAVPRRPVAESRLRYFLDGTQRTLPVWRCGLVPIIATITAAAILGRDNDGRCGLVPGTLRLRHVWLIPHRAPTPALAELLARIRAAGGDVVDPLAKIDDADEYAAFASDYGHLVELAHLAAGRVREDVERRLLEDWAADPLRLVDDGWIVVDGRLLTSAERAIGLVKQFTNSYLAGADAETLLDLRPGHRTTAFFPTDRFRGGQEPGARTLWYLRLWDATGQDARHSLVRVEAPQSVRRTSEIDDISAWLMAERTPRATADARWATLLYPIHLLERILKRRLEADTRGWPGT